MSDVVAGSSQAIALDDIQLNLTPKAAPDGGGWPVMQLDGTLGGKQVKRIEVHGTGGGAIGAGTATIEIERFHIDDALVEWARAVAPHWLKATRLGGVIDGALTLQWSNCSTPPTVRGALSMSDGRVDDPRLPEPVTELAGKFVIDGATLQVRELRGRCGTATVAASLNRTGWSRSAPMALSARAENVVLDAPLYRTLSGANSAGLTVAGLLCDQWDRFRPAGMVDATLQATFDGTKWTPAAALIGHGLSFESDKFPYRLTDGEGTIRCLPAVGVEPKRVEIDLTAIGGGQPLHIIGQVINPQPSAAGWLEITGENVEIDQRMLEAIPHPKSRDVIAQLHPAGRFNLHWRLDRPTPGAAPLTSLELDFTDLRINYDRFPYPLRGIRGKVAAEGNRWTFRNLESGGRRAVRGEGYLQPCAEGMELSLRFTAQAAPLDDDLFEALAPSAPAAQQAWTELQPRGQVDLIADVLHRTGMEQPNIAVVIRPRPDSTQLRPKFFPYLMENVAGTATYRDGRVELTGLKAQHDRTEIRTNGNGYFWPDGHWQFQLAGLTADHVTARQDLTSALPPSLRNLVEHLRPTGNFRIHDGVLAFRKSGSSIAPLESEWDVAIDCHQTDLQCGIDLENVHGAVRLAGRSDGVRSYSTGELNLETVTFQGVQFTEVRGPLWVNDSKCLLGKWATEAEQQPERRLAGRVYDGALGVNAWVTFDNLPAYQAEVHVTGASLRRLVVERFGGQRQFDGKVDATVMLGGRGYQLDSLVGDGDVHIRDADLYELSLLASLLKILRTGAADKTAFTQSDIAFRLEGRHIYLDQIDFLGDVVNLYGKGETNFDQQLTLVFSAVVGRHDYQLPFVKNLVREANQQIMQMYVNGTLSEPQVTTEAFPGIAQVLQQIGSDLKNPMQAAEARQVERRRLAAQQQQRE